MSIGGQPFGNSEEFRAAVKDCLITQKVGQLSGISGWFERCSATIKKNLMVGKRMMLMSLNETGASGIIDLNKQ